MIIGLSGLAGSGKDTVAGIIVDQYDDFTTIALADEIKETAKRWYGFTNQQLWGASELRNTPSPWYPELICRDVLQKLGTEVGRNIYGQTWIDFTMRECRNHYNVVIPDVRWPQGNEGKAIRAAGGKLVRIKRPSAGLAGTASQHESETKQQETPDSFFDYIINNNGSIDDLHLKIRVLMEDLNIK